MRALGVWLTLLVLVGCTEPNTAATCRAGTCSDPAFPYCDADGVVAGEPGRCIAVTCTPGEVLTCAAGDAVTCTTTGDGYERVACDLDCFTTPAPHCAYIEPRYVPDACAAPAPDESLMVTSSATLDPNLDSNCNGGIVVQTGTVDICVLHYGSIVVPSDKTLTLTGTGNVTAGRVVALVADTNIVVEGTIDVSAHGPMNGPGGGVVTSGGAPKGMTSSQAMAGAGGAGRKTAGAAGGTAAVDGGAANGGEKTSDPAFLAALLGGASAYQYGDNTTVVGGGGGGGGITLIACNGSVSVTGTIDAGGGGGSGGFNFLVAIGGFAGGAGGYVVIQGKDIAVSGQLFANGGGGGGGMQPSGTNGAGGADGSLSGTDAAQGGYPQNGEGKGGNGGVGETPPTVGGARTVSPATAGGGGGSVGFFQTYSPQGREPQLTPSAASPAFQPNGTIRTR